MSIRIVTDSTCDLPDSIIEQYQIEVVPAYVNIGTQSLTDGVQLQRAEFYANIESYSPHPTTAAPAPGVFTEAYDKMVGEGATQILSIHISAELSGFYNSARLGAEATDYDISLVDSRNVTMGLGLLVLKAAQAIEAGQSKDEIVAMLNSLIPRTVVYAAADTLAYLRASGRVGFATAGLGSLLKIKPILQVKDGQATSFDRVRTRSKVPPKLIELVDKLGELEELAIVYSKSSTRAEGLRAALEDKFSADSPQIVTVIGPAIGAHIGPNALGVACIRKA